MGVTFAGMGVAIFRVVEDNIMQSLDAALITAAKSVLDSHLSQRGSMEARRESHIWESLLDDFFAYGQVPIRSYAQLIDMSGKIRAKTRNVQASLPVTPRAVSRAEAGLETLETFNWERLPALRQVTLPVMLGTRFTGALIQVGTPMDGAVQALGSVRNILWIAMPLGLIVSILVGYLLTTWSLRPVTKITAAAAGLGVNDLNQRLRLPLANDELKNLTRTFNEMLDRLEDAFTRLRRFPGDVSHELRTPLAVLRGEAELALRRERSPEEYRGSLTTIVAEASNMSRIVEDLLLLARAQGESIAMQWQTIDLGNFLKELEAAVRPQLIAKDISLEVVYREEAEIQLSPHYFHLALKNILLNAIRHSAVGAKIELKVVDASDGSEFSIRDFGEGIPPDALPYLFDPFYRADTVRNRASGGVGIGLSLVKALVKLHSGTLRVESEINKGACFIIKLPASGKPQLQSARAPCLPMPFHSGAQSSC